MLNFSDFIQVYVFTTNHHLKHRIGQKKKKKKTLTSCEVFLMRGLNICFLRLNRNF